MCLNVKHTRSIYGQGDRRMNTCMKWMWVLNDYKSTCKGLWWQSLMTQTFHLQSLERAVTFKTIISSTLKPQLSKTHYFHCHFIITLSLIRVTLSPSYSFHSSPVQTKISAENKRAKLLHVSNTPIRSSISWRTRHTTEQLLELPPACVKG